MYNTYTYDLSKDVCMNVNLHLIDCFEEVDYSDNINEIIDRINSTFISTHEEKEEKEKPIRSTTIKTIKSRVNRYKK